MEIKKGYIVTGMLIAFLLFMEIAAHADMLDQATKLTFSGPVQIPGQVLPAGTYLFKVVNPETGLNIVQVFNADGTVLYATLQTAATERPERAAHTVVALAEQGTGQPDALVKWFYPGEETGHEFLYPSQKEKELAQDTERTIVAGQPTASSSNAAAVGN